MLKIYHTVLPVALGKKLHCPEVILNRHVPGCTGVWWPGGGAGHGGGGLAWYISLS